MVIYEQKGNDIYAWFDHAYEYHLDNRRTGHGSLDTRTRKAHLIWLICIVVVTLVVNVWHSMKKDESDRKDPKREKYERKVNKRK